MLALFCAITFFIDLYFNVALVERNHFYHDSYDNKTPEAAIHKYMTQITPASWLVFVWVVIYAAFILWFLYVFYLLICRQLCSRDNKSPLFPSLFWFLFIIVNVLNAVWLSLFSHDDMIVSGIVLLILTVTLYALNIMAYRACWFDITYYNDSNDVASYDGDIVELSRCEVTLLRILTLNGLPLYAMWCTLAATLQWAIIFQYFLFHWSDNLSCIIPLAILSVLLLMYWGMSILINREYFVWTWAPCLVLIVGFVATIVKHHSIGGMHAPAVFFVFILLIVTSIMIMLRLVTLCLCRPKSPSPQSSRV